MHSIEFFEKIIIGYYECLSNDIDIVTESFLKENYSNISLGERIQNKRKNWIEKINSTKKDNLINLATIQNFIKGFHTQKNSESINYELFKNGFLFLSKEKNFADWKLIYKKGYISEFSRRKFK